MPSVDGLISGLDTTNIITQLLELRSIPVQRLQDQITGIEEEQSAFVGLTAKLVSMKLAVDDLGKTRTFQSKNVTSSNESVISASAGSSTPVGSFQMTVAKLAQSAQYVSSGFVDKDTTPVGEGQFTVELGNGNVARNTKVDFLNGQTGIDRGSVRFTDGNGGTAVVDFSDVISAQDVIDRINNTASFKIRASFTGDSIKLEDISGAGVPSVTVEEVGTDNTAASLGLLKSSVSGIIVGDQINKLSSNTRLDLLNDGLGVRSNGGIDFQANFKDGSAVLNVDIGTPTTLGQLVTNINNATGNNGRLIAAINENGNGVTLTDTTAGANPFTLAAVGGSQILTDLGLTGITAELNGVSDAANGTVYTGKRILADLGGVLTKSLNGGSGVADGSITITDRAGGGPATLDLSGRKSTTLNGAILAGATSLVVTDATGFHVGSRIRITDGTNTEYRQITNVAGTTITFDEAITNGYANGSGVYASNENSSDVIDAINNVAAISVTAGLNEVGNGFQLKDTSGGTGRLLVNEVGAGTTAANLGLLNFYDNAGANYTVDSGTTLSVTSAAATGFGDDFFNGMTLEVMGGPLAGETTKIIDYDSTAGTFTFETQLSGTLANPDTFRINGVDFNTYNGRNANVQYIGNETKLEDLNAGKGVFEGSFQITDRENKLITVDINGDTTVGEVITTINGAAAGAGSSLTASINSTGDGILLTSGVGTGSITVVELDNGTTAKDLNILGTSSTSTLDGAFEFTISISSTDTLEDVRDKINGLNQSVQASILSDGNGVTPYRLNVQNTVSGDRGVMLMDNITDNFSFDKASEAQDSALLMGSTSGGIDPILVTDNDNHLVDILPGLVLDLGSVSTSAVTLTVSRDSANLADEVQAFVDQYNEIMDDISELTAFDPDSLEAGLLLGDFSIRQTVTALEKAVLTTIDGLPTTMNRLSRVGLSYTTEGRLSFDKSEFEEQLDDDFDGVSQLFVNGASITTQTEISTLRGGLGLRTTAAGADIQFELKDGSSFTIDVSDTLTIAELLDQINSDPNNNGLTAAVNNTSTGLTFTDTTGGTGSLVISNLNDSFAATDLKITGNVSDTTLDGRDINLNGIASILSAALDKLTNGTNGTLFFANDTREDKIESIQDSIDRMLASIEAERDRLITQFSAMESTLASLQQTSSFLSQSLSGLAAG